MDLGKAIRKIRKTKNLTQAELAKKANISITALSQIEKGESQPQKQTLENICTSLNITKNYLLIFAIDTSDIAPDKKDMFNLLFEPLKKLVLEDIK